MSVEQQAQHDSDYESLEALFIALLRSLRTENMELALYELAERRTEIAFRYVTSGLKVDVDEAIQLLQNLDDNTLTQYQKDLRDRLSAAIDNLIDFSVCEEYQLYEEVLELIEDDDIDFDSDMYEDLLNLCRKYNDQYSAVENTDIEYAGAMAAMWIRMSAKDYVVYWTQNDVKVRPWHMALQGYVAPRDEFPSWMIPPIEYNCRCYLETLEVPYASADVRNIKGSATSLKKPEQISGVYDEALAKCGRIFSPAHSYFTIKDSDKEMLENLVNRLKTKYYATEI